MPTLIGKESKKRELIANLPTIYETIARQQRISIGDFPPIERMKEILMQQDFKSFSQLQPRLISAVDNMLRDEVAKLLEMIPSVRLFFCPYLSILSQIRSFLITD